MKVQYLKVFAVLIWFGVEVARWLERRNLINNISSDLVKKFRNVQKEISNTVQSSTSPVLSSDPDNRDNDRS